MGEGVSLELSTHKDIVSLKILHGTSPSVDAWFGSSSGLMGSFHESKTLARDGVTLLEDPNELGQEWQVLDSDPKLFQNTDRAPQFPEKCHLPDAAAAQKRRLLGGAVSRDEAAEACAHWNEDERKNCIADVLATNDLELAEFSGY
ncbi:hypothetical protein SEMRO_206_G086710.1 [Seminavis robusta]|uniref:Uncharacterized protein n=1 Tax=Seminavis robusta TaxID=568900 RepID=A0A9N8DKE5_9STRA|nr:hypothetical protein SEMRO_206_G086710.1 [Seminavis robusta]|eukprot:Sro206_g086710.1 n/a (146) ;mRNA; f:85004-85525